MTQIILSLSAAGRFSLLGFYAARARRIIPALVVMVVLVCLAGWFYLPPVDYKGLGKHAVGSVAFVSNIIYWLESGYFDVESHQKWLLHTWSLSVEWQYYLVFPLLVSALQRFNSGKFLKPGIGLGFVISLLLSVVQSQWYPSAAFYLLPARGWEFFAGALVYLYAQHLNKNLNRYNGGIILIGCAALVYTADLAYPGWYALLPVLGTSMVIAAGNPGILLRNSVIQFFGRISYSFYLWHWPVLIAARYSEIELTLLTLCLLLGIAILLAYGSWRLVETPLRKGAPTVRPPTYLLKYAVVSLAVAIPCGWLWLNGGVAQRAAPELREKIAANEQQLNAWDYPGKCQFVDQLCMLGEPAPRKVLFWGDSHIEQWYPVLMDLLRQGKNHGYQIIIAGSGGCVPIRHLNRIQPGYDCAGFNEKVFQRALQPDIHAVVLGSIWSTYFRDDIFTGSGQPTVCNASAGCARFDSAHAAVQFAQQQLRHDIQQWVAQQKAVYVLLPVPVYRYSVPLYMARHWFLHKPMTLSQTLLQHRQYAAPALELLTAATQNTTAVMLDPAALLCASGTCINAHDGVSLYKDSNHLVPRATLGLAPLFSRVFESSS